MKNILKYIACAFFATLVFTACAPQESDDHSLGNLDGVTVDMISFTQTPSSTSNNILTFTNTTNISGPNVAIWDLGNGTTGRGVSITTSYPLAGTYTISLTISTADGSTATKTQTITIANDDYSLLDTPIFRMLTGGPSNANGRTWVLDRYNRYSSDIAKSTGRDIRGHMGLGPSGGYSQSWWGAGANEKSNWKLYDMKFNFSQASGLSLKITTLGEGYGRVGCANVGGFTITSSSGDDAIFNYAGGNYSYSVNDAGTYPTLTLTGNAFMGYYCGTQDYNIIFLSNEAMALRVLNSTEGQDWVFVYVREDLNVAP